jgi:hypothetical protein
MEGKVIRYDGAKGDGSIILKEGNVLEFSIKDWSSFDTLPSIGLAVSIDDGKIYPTNIKQSENDSPAKTKLINKRDEYINGSVANGWKVESINDLGFVITNSQFEWSTFVVWTFVVSIPLVFVFGIYGVPIAAVISYFITTSTGDYTLQGAMNYEDGNIVIKKNGKHHKTLGIEAE